MKVLKMLTFIILVTAFLFPGQVRSQGADDFQTVLTNCNVIDCTGKPVKENMTVIITGNEITSIRKGTYRQSRREENVRIIDLDGAYVLPGFFNMHVHMAGLFPRNPNLSEELPDAAVIRAGLNAMDGIRHGFTTIRTMGDHDY